MLPSFRQFAQNKIRMDEKARESLQRVDTLNAAQMILDLLRETIIVGKQ